MASAITYDAPLSADVFVGRNSHVRAVIERLLHNEFLSTSVVGGPKTGKTSLLRFLASDYALFPNGGVAIVRVYFDADQLGSQSNPNDFWIGAFRAIHADQRAADFHVLLETKIVGAKSGEIDEYDLQDVFDAFAKAGSRVALMIDNFDTPLHSDNFWSTGAFFHHLRTLGQRTPRGVAFVTATTRPLLDLQRPATIASPYYNIFINLPLGHLDGDDIAAYVAAEFKKKSMVDSNDEVRDLVLTASEGHPLLVAFVLDLCLQQRVSRGQIDQDAIVAELQNPNGPVVMLIRRIREELSAIERQLLDASKTRQLTPTQHKQLEQLRIYGLLPPGYAV